MVPPKRRSSQTPVEHHGRVTHSANVGLPKAAPPAVNAPRATRREPSRPEPSSRYTPPKAAVRLRPAWHRWFGLGVLLAGGLIAVLNDVPLFGGRSVLPFGHSELYLLLALAVAGSATRFFGWFDRPE